MCSECCMTPCHPRCPNAPDPPAVCVCSECGEDIRDGDWFYSVKEDVYCEACMEDMKKIAEAVE